MEQVVRTVDFLKSKPNQLLLKNYELGEILGTGKLYILTVNR